MVGKNQVKAMGLVKQVLGMKDAKKKEQEKHEKHVDHDVAEECSRAMRLVDDVKRQQDVMQKLLDGQTE